mgnify:CR=1 FL=1
MSALQDLQAKLASMEEELRQLRLEVQHARDYHAICNLQAAYAAALRFAERPEGWLLFMGGYGCGKTHLAAAIAHARLARGDSVFFIVVPDLLDYLRATFRPNSPVGYDERFEAIR